jgi:hypothetical protein
MRFGFGHATPLFLFVACGEIAPPLEQLPLRDTLRANPEVVAALDDGTRQRIADRLLLMRGSETAADESLDDLATPPQELVARLDRAREQRGQDALLAAFLDDSGVVHSVQGAVNGTVHDATPGIEAPFPPLETGGPPPPTLEMESRALAGRAQGELRALLALSGARHLQRVVGWPIGAIAIGDRVYVSAAWLAALAPAAPDDGGADAGSTAAPGGPAPVAGELRSEATTATGANRAQPAAHSDDTSTAPRYDGGVTIVSSLSGYDGGVYIPPPNPTPPPPPVSSGDDCAAACASSSSGGDDCGSSSSGDDCSSTDDGSGGDCSSSTDDGSGCETSDDEGEGCQVARGRRRDGKGTLLTLSAPLAFLLPRRRR